MSDPDPSSESWKHSFYKYRSDLSNDNSVVFFLVDDASCLRKSIRKMIDYLGKKKNIFRFVKVTSANTSLLQMLSWQGKIDGLGILAFIKMHKKTGESFKITKENHFLTSSQWNENSGSLVKQYSSGRVIKVE